jgi:hypothetical protein
MEVYVHKYGYMLQRPKKIYVFLLTPPTLFYSRILMETHVPFSWPEAKGMYR